MQANLVAVRDFDDFASQRNAALSLATGDWVLSIDADERVTPAARRRGSAQLSFPIRRATCTGATASRSDSIILGRRFAFSGTQHDLPLRLFRRGASAAFGAGPGP